MKNYKKGNVKYKHPKKYEFCTNELEVFDRLTTSKILRCKDLCTNCKNCVYFKEWVQMAQKTL